MGKKRTGVDLIAAERERHVTEEGYTAEHDAGHDHELASAAAMYALPAAIRPQPLHSSLPWAWPWPSYYWKPTPNNRVRELVKAGALIAAAIDSLLAEEDDESEDAGA